MLRFCDKDGGPECQKQYDADKSVRRKKRGVHPRKIVRFYERVLIDHQAADRSNTRQGDPAEFGIKVQQRENDKA